MYCSTCELEIKGDDKQTCPICGGTLVAIDAGGSNSQDPQEQSALHDIIEDINSLIDGDAPVTSAPEQEAVFVLKDYEDVSQEFEEQPQAPEPQLFAASFADEPEMQAPVEGDASQDADVSLQDKLDSIKQSLDLFDTPDADKDGAVRVPQDDTEEFGFPQTFEPDGVFPDESADGQAAFLTEFEGNESELISAHPAEGRRKPGLLLVLLVVLLGVLGYYGYRLVSDDSGLDEQPSTKRTVVPLAALKSQEKQTGTETGAVDPSPDAVSTVPADDALHDGAAADAQPPQDAEAGQKSAPPAGAAPAADKPIAAVQPEAAAEPTLEKPAAPAQTRPEAQREVPAAPAQGSAALEPSPAVVPPARGTPPVTAPFYTVHVGSFRKQSVAASETARISAKGHDAFVERADLGQRGIWFRVKVGRFKTRAEAESLKSKIDKVLVPEGIVVMNQKE